MVTVGRGWRRYGRQSSGMVGRVQRWWAGVGDGRDRDGRDSRWYSSRRGGNGSSGQSSNSGCSGNSGGDGRKKGSHGRARDRARDIVWLSSWGRGRPVVTGGGGPVAVTGDSDRE